MFQICFYVPDNAAETVKNAMFDVGAGHIGHYDRCSWQSLGQGQFRPLPGSQPVIGNQGVVETIAELKVEMICQEHCINAAIAAMKQAHPYEVVAHQIIRLACMDDTATPTDSGASC
jgi:hypothetical protein